MGFVYRKLQRKRLCRIGGEDGKAEASKIMSRLMEKLFDLKMIAEFSWSGVQKNKNAAKKMSFRSNKKIIALIKEVLMKADSSWSDVKNDAKLQTYLKHPKINRQKPKKDADAGESSQRELATSSNSLHSDEANEDSRESLHTGDTLQNSGQNSVLNEEQASGLDSDD